MTPARSSIAKGKPVAVPSKRGGVVCGRVRLSALGDKIVVWLEEMDVRPKRIGSVKRQLAADARCHGQDIVGDLIDVALREADRRSLRSSGR